MSDFWVRRKQAVAKEARADARVLEEAEAAKTEAELAERSDEELLAELELAQPEDLDSPDAVREFLSSAVPQRLKTRALRRLWTLNPVLANLDGLIDYGEDFTDSATVIENLQTAYQVGKGMMAHIEELAKAQAEKEPVNKDGEIEAEEEDVFVEADLEDLPASDSAEQHSEPAVVVSTYADIAANHDDEVIAQPQSTPRRMQFRFEEPA